MAYSKLALVYDDLMQDAPYEKWIDFTIQRFNEANKDITTIADLGCGTGEITIRLAQEGYQLYGVDLSSEMLTIAEQKATKENINISWINQDMRTLSGLQVDAVISYCDAINYLTTLDDLKDTFTKVWESLQTGGIFIFDIHGLNYVENAMVNQTFTHVANHVSYIWDCFPGENSGEMYHEITFFVSDEHDKYSRFDEHHHQRTHPLSVYQQLLQNIGFTNLQFYGDFSSNQPFSEDSADRILIVAIKGSRK